MYICTIYCKNLLKNIKVFVIMILVHNLIIFHCGEILLVKGVFSFSAYHSGDCVPTMREFTFSVRSLRYGERTFLFPIICVVNFARFTSDVVTKSKGGICYEKSLESRYNCRCSYYSLYSFASTNHLGNLK